MMEAQFRLMILIDEFTRECLNPGWAHHTKVEASSLVNDR
jgi:hypothetical protein